MTVLAAVFVVAAGGELFARYCLGLGDPPLLLRDPEIEYVNKPGCYRRFGNSVCYNRWTMRSDAIEPAKVDPTELRVMVIGDSVVHGGALTDQVRIATSLLQAGLRADGAKATVMNVAAGSWGPPNQLAYVRRYGWFDADDVILVENTGDIDDVPNFPADLGPDQPVTAPSLALVELVERYLPHYLPQSLQPKPYGDPPRVAEDEALREGSGALSALLAEAKAHAKGVAVVHHRERGEPPRSPNADLLDRTISTAGVPEIDDQPWLAGVRGAYREEGTIHLSDSGLAIHARLYRCIVDALRGGLPVAERCAKPETASR